MTDEQRDLVYEQLQETRQDLKDAVKELRDLVDRVSQQHTRTQRDLTIACDERRAEIYSQIQELRQRDAELSEKQFRYFAVGTGLGTLFGAIVTAVVQITIRGGTY